MVFDQTQKESILANNDTIGKGISRGAEWCKFQLRSTFHAVRSYGSVKNLIKTPDYSARFSALIVKAIDFGKQLNH